MKRALDDLAVFGGRPLFDHTLHVGRPNVGDRERFHRLLDEMLARNWLTNNGPLVRELEARIEDFLRVSHCVAITNGTVALEIAIRALDLKGDVLVPSFTFVATAHALWWQGIRPVFCDIDPVSHCLDPADAERRITPQTSGILAVNVWGKGCDVERLERVASRHRLELLFDSAHAFGSSHNGRMIGNFGRCEVLSFHATKFFNTIEGGAIVTNDTDLAAKIRLMRNFGFAGLDSVVYIGTNGKMSEACAAMGLTNLDALDAVVATNQRNYEAYRSSMAEIEGITVVPMDDSERSNFQYVVVEIQPGFGLTRDELMRVLHAENVRVRRYFWPCCHRMEPYISAMTAPSPALLASELVSTRTLQFPTGMSVDLDKIASIGNLLRFVSTNARSLRERGLPGDLADETSWQAEGISGASH